jgi:hypothetical protein
MPDVMENLISRLAIRCSFTHSILQILKQVHNFSNYGQDCAHAIILAGHIMAYTYLLHEPRSATQSIRWSVTLSI